MNSLPEPINRYVSNIFGHTWLNAIVVLVVAFALIVWLFRKDGEPRYKTIIRVWFVSGPITLLILGIAVYYEYVSPLWGSPPANKFVIRIAQFEPIASDAETASKNFPNKLAGMIDDLDVSDIDVKYMKDWQIKGDNDEELENDAKKAGLRENAHMVIFGNVRCNKDFPNGCSDNFDTSPIIVLTEGPTMRGSDINSIGGMSFIPLGYKNVRETRDIVRFIHGLKKYQRMNYGEALDIFSTLPIDNNDELLFYLGNAEYLTGDDDAALDAYEKAININPNYFLNFYNKGVILGGLGRNEDALSCFEEVNRLKPNFAEAYGGKGVAYSNLGDFDDAIKCFDKAIELKPNLVEAYLVKGNFLFNLRRYSEAVSCFDEAIRLNPGIAEAHFGKGDALVELGKNTEAIISLERAVDLKHDFPEAYFIMGNAYFNLGKFKKAIVCYDKVLIYKTDYSEAYNNRGNSYLMLDDIEKALDSYNEAINVDKLNANAYYNKANVSLVLKDYSTAISSYDKALTLQPNYLKTHNSTQPFDIISKGRKDVEVAFKKAKERNPNIKLPPLN